MTSALSGRAGPLVVLGVVSALVASLAAIVPTGIGSRGAEHSGSRVVRAEPDGRALYLLHCAGCHGEEGRGDGGAADLLYPRPRDLTAYTFRLASTDNGVPTDEDLHRVITEGMVGSAMPPHDQLSEEERGALVREVRRIATEETMKRLLEEDPGLDQAVAREVAFRQPGHVPELPPPIEITPERMAEGRLLYLRNCASCHGQDGIGGGRTDMVDAKGHPLFARDFTGGIMKGGTGSADLFRRIRLGMPGTPMPSHESLSDGEIWALVTYVKSLIRPGAQEQLAQRHIRLVAKRVSGELTEDSGAPVWEGIPSRWLAMAPLWWRDERVVGALVQVAHDGTRLAFRMTWEDASEDLLVVSQQAFSDAAAVQLHAGEDPPFFAMGQPAHPVDIWYWRAADQLPQDIQTAHPRVGQDVELALKQPPVGEHAPYADHPLSAYDRRFLTGWAVGNPVSSPERETPVQDLCAEGFGTLAPRKPPLVPIRGRAHWDRAVWTLVMVRELGAETGTAQKPGGTLSAAFAIWNGSAGDRNGQKNLTVWHRLELEP